MGFFAGRTHYIIDNTDCALGAAINNKILTIIKSYMKDNNITPYNEEKGNGTVRHILIRNGYHTNEIMVCVVINGKSLKNSEYRHCHFFKLILSRLKSFIQKHLSMLTLLEMKRCGTYTVV